MYITPTTILAGGALTALVFYLVVRGRRTRRWNHPPGPPEWPVFGSVFSLLFTKLQQHEILFQWSATYGGIFSFTMLGTRVVVLSDEKLIRETLQDPYVSDKIPFPACETILGRPNTGIAFASGSVFKEQQRFFLTVFRKVNSSVIKFEEIIASQVLRFLEEMESYGGKSFNPTDLVTVSVSNVIMKIVTGKTYSFDDPDFLRIAACSDRLSEIIGPAGLLGMISWLASLPLPAKEELTELMRTMLGFIRQHVDEHKASYSPDEPATDFISCYLKEMARRSKVPDDESTFDEINLLQTCWDAIFPGFETSISTLRWTYHLLASHPELQARVRREISDVVGSDRLPTFADRHNLPLTEATIAESMRLRPVIPYVAPHVASRDRKIAGYDVPAGTRVTINLWYVARSPALWDEPDKFRPERFLDQEGCFDRSLEPVLFSYGQRACPGEQLARMELFLFVTFVLQRFSLRLPAGASTELGGRMGATFRPDQFELEAVIASP
ncbi:cytochrome P450 2U1-like [Diadema antillarum]|uniref:cytochrome P450 2U1-like n=1 Tax=Diadema antillarum TaxID=105358 RepID=UPI003A83CBE9